MCNLATTNRSQVNEEAANTRQINDIYSQTIQVNYQNSRTRSKKHINILIIQ